MLAGLQAGEQAGEQAKATHGNLPLSRCSCQKASDKRTFSTPEVRNLLQGEGRLDSGLLRRRGRVGGDNLAALPPAQVGLLERRQALHLERGLTLSVR